LRTIRVDVKATRRLEIRLAREESSSTARSGECVVVAWLLHAGERTDGCLSFGWTRSISRLHASTALWPPCPCAGFDGRISSVDCGQRGNQFNQSHRARPRRFYSQRKRNLPQ